MYTSQISYAKFYQEKWKGFDENVEKLQWMHKQIYMGLDKILQYIIKMAAILMWCNRSMLGDVDKFQRYRHQNSVWHEIIVNTHWQFVIGCIILLIYWITMIYKSDDHYCTHTEIFNNEIIGGCSCSRNIISKRTIYSKR